MKTEQILIQKKKTLADISPIWNKHLQEYPNESGRGMLILAPIDSPFPIMQISDSKTCVVGEAHGFSGRYLRDGSRPCLECVSFSQDFYDFFNVGRYAFNYKLDKFVEHWNDKHV